MNPFPYSERILEDRVHGSLYTDRDVFAEEHRRIWQSDWLAVGHESEVPTAGDYVQKRVAGEPVIMVRGSDGELRLLLNRCSHRGNQVCDSQSGNAKAFRCPYHGWTFANTGSLRGFPFSGGYDETTRKSELGLGQIPRVDTYQGFVFASLAADGPTLREHLGAATETLDRLVSFSPLGRVQLTAGWLRHRTRANWKLLLENETDGYHPRFVHNSILSITPSQLSDAYTDKSESLVRDLGDGHTELDLRPEFRKRGALMHWFNSDEESSADYVASMRDAHGRERADELMIDGPPHVMIWPNLFVAEIFLLILEPVDVDLTVQLQTPILFEGADRLNARILRQFEGSVGPAGMLLADDSVMYERNQRGVSALKPEWLMLRRGLHREVTETSGQRYSNATDETSQRAIWRRYRQALGVS